MKRITTFTLLFAFATTSFSQHTVQKQPWTKADYQQKGKNQKKIGTVLLLSGAGLIATSFIIPRGELTYDGICVGPYCDDHYKNDGLKAGVFIAGGISALGSIPFFIASHKNKKEANAPSVFIKMEKAAVLQQGVIRNQPFPSMGMRISL